MIRVGEKLLQKMGSKRPMLLGTFIVVIGIALISLVLLPGIFYVISCVVGYLCFGLGLGIYATPSTDTALSNAPLDKVGVASGIYKSAHRLVAHSVSQLVVLYMLVQLLQRIGTVGSHCAWVALMGIMAFIAILFTILMMINVSKMRNNNDDTPSVLIMI